MNIKNGIVALAIGFFLTACNNDDNGGSSEPLGAYENGILVTNEGPFNNGTGTVSFIAEDYSTSENSIYSKVNNADLGNIVQSMAFVEDKAYIIANVSNTITVVNRYTFEKLATIDAGLNNPRYFAAVNGKGYVTNWGDTGDDTDDFVAVINLETNSVEGNVPVDFGPEDMVVNGSTIYVAHQGAFGYNDKISVIDASTNAISDTIEVGLVPNSMQIDAAGNLWVLSAGKPSFSGEETSGILQKVDLATNSVTTTWDFEVTQHPNHLSLDGSTLYYSLEGEVFGMDISASELPTESDFTGLRIYGMTTKNGLLYVTDAKDFASNGTLSVLSLSTKSEMQSVEVGLIPGGIYFNE